MTQVSYGSAGVTAPATNTPNDAAFFRAILDAIMTGYNATDTLVSGAVSSGSGNGGKVAKFATDGSMSFTGVSAFGAITTTSTIVASDSIATNGNLVAAGVIRAGTQSNQITTTVGLLDATKLTNTAPASIIGANTITDDMLAGLAYSVSPAGAMQVRVAAQNIWNGTNFIQFTQADSPAIVTTGIGSGNARIDLLYIDQSGRLQWQPGFPAQASTAQLPQAPALAFVPVVYVKTYNGALAILTSDQGHDAFFYANARLKTNPLGASAISVHSLPINRLQDLAAYQTPTASLTVNIAPGGYFNSQRVWVDYNGGTYVYTTTSLNNAQPRWDLLYLDDLGAPQTTPGTPAATNQVKPQPTTGQYPVAYLYLPPSTTAIFDYVNYTAAPGQAYILYAQGLLSASIATVSGSTATGITASVGGGAVTGLSGFPSGSGYTNANPPAFIFSGGGGTGAAATPVLTAGVITGYTGLVGGSGYGTAPTVTVSTAGGVTPVALGGTGATSAPGARTNLNAAAAGNNGDISGLTALTSVTPAVSFSSNVSVTGNLGQGGATAASIGFLQGGTVSSAGGNAFGIAQNSALKPVTSAANVTWAQIANLGTVDMSSLTAIGNNVSAAYGLRTGTITRDGTNPSVYAVNTITPAGSITAGTLAIGDGTNTTATINATDTVATINTRLAAATPAAIQYTATGSGPLSAGNIITLTALSYNPGRKAALTLPTNAPTGGGTLAIAQTYAGAPYISNAYGLYANQPSGGQNNYAIFANGVTRIDPNAGAGDPAPSSTVTGALQATKAFTTTANDNVLVVTAVHTATASAGNTQKNGIGVYVRQDENSTLGSGSPVTRDLVAGDFQAWVNDGPSQGRVFALHTQVNVGLGGTGADGNVIGYEGQIVNFGSDVSNASQVGSNVQKVGIALNAPGPNPITAYMVFDAGGSTSHHGLYARVAALGSGANDSFLLLENAFVVRPTGAAVFGATALTTGVMADVRGDVRSTGMVRMATNAQNTTLATSGNIDPANGQVQRFNPGASLTGVNLLAPAAARVDGAAAAGSTLMLILINESPTNTIAFAAFNAGTNPVLGAVTIAVRTSQIYIWDPAVSVWYKVV